MQRFPLVYRREQDDNGNVVDLIIILLDKSFGDLSRSIQHQRILELQTHAGSAGLVGTVCPVWSDSTGKLFFIAPRQWHPYFERLTLDWVQANVNRTLEIH